jgi:Mrp family chromosome partitioning ATPase
MAQVTANTLSNNRPGEAASRPGEAANRPGEAPSLPGEAAPTASNREATRPPLVKCRHLVPSRQFAALAGRVMALKPSANSSTNSSTTVGIGSSVRGEGSTTVASNLAAALTAASSGDVLLINTVGIHQNGRQRRAGWLDLVQGRIELLDAVQVTDTSRFYVMGVGQSVPKTRVIYNPERVAAVIQGLKEKFAYVVVDLPSADEQTECMPIAKELDGVILVLKAGRATSVKASRVHERYQDHGANVIGVVLNQTRSFVPRLLRYFLGLNDPNQ